jgi:hypothetical protein
MPVLRASRLIRGAHRDRHGRWARDAMDAGGIAVDTASSRSLMMENASCLTGIPDHRNFRELAPAAYSNLIPTRNSVRRTT